MKGVINKKDNSWFVKYQDYSGWGLVELKEFELPLHPDNANQIKEYERVFDNIDARILSNPNIEFEPIEIKDEKGKGVLYAKITNL